jgi:hypothetical protein
MGALQAAEERAATVLNSPGPVTNAAVAGDWTSPNSGPFDDPRPCDLDREAQPFIAARPELRRGSTVLEKFGASETRKAHLAERISSQYRAHERLQLAISSSISDKSASTSRCVHLGALVDSTIACPARILKLR